MNEIPGILLALMICMITIAPAIAQPTPSTPFLIRGWVTDSEGDPLDNPDLVITDLDTLEEFTAETHPGSNYYQVMTSSENVSAGDELSFSVNGGTPTNHDVTQAEIDAGGFEENLTAEEETGLCGDVDGDRKVTMFDGRQIWMNLIYGETAYPLECCCND